MSVIPEFPNFVPFEEIRGEELVGRRVIYYYDKFGYIRNPYSNPLYSVYKNIIPEEQLIGVIIEDSGTITISVQWKEGRNSYNYKALLYEKPKLIKVGEI